MPYSGRETLCKKCVEQRRPKQKVYLKFTKAQVWGCQFLSSDLKITLPLQLNLQTDEKLFELAEKGGASMNFEGRLAIEHAINSGAGGVWLELTTEQYSKLRIANR